MFEDGVAGACVLFDGESFSLGGGDATGKSGGGDEMVAGHLHRKV